MILRLLISLSLLLAWQKASAQLTPTAEQFFNGGAQLYISNNIPSALEQVENGLKIYPDDVKLKKLEELLKQQQQSQSRQNQQQQQNQQSQQSQSQQQKNQQLRQNQQQKQDQQQSQQNQQSQNQSALQNKQQQGQSGQKENEGQQSAANQGQEMTPEEAKQLLDAQKGDEQVLQLKPPGKPGNQNQPIKDW